MWQNIKSFTDPGHAALRAPIWLRLCALMLTVVPLLGLMADVVPALDLINAALPAFAIAALILLGVSYLRGHFYTAVVLLVGFSLSVIRLAAAVFGSTSGTGADGPQITLVTLSAYHANQIPDQLRRAIEASNADILLLQESDGTGRRAIKASLPHFHHLPSCSRPRCSMTILSRWPLIRLTKPRAGNSDLPDILSAHVAHPVVPFNIVTVHLPRLTHSSAVHHRDALVKMINALALDPLIVAGDFNLTPGMIALTKFEGATNLARATNFTPTYPAPPMFPPLFPIDHVYLSPGWSSRGCHTMSRTGSDHLGLKCALVMLGWHKTEQVR
jgi:endonuclease/exonuclease/phosphatase family metal-dependent hydrolase